MPFEYKPIPIGLTTEEELIWRKENGQYPYWKTEFDKEFKGFQVWYCEGSKPKHSREDMADDYRVFMILCGNNFDKTRMEVLKMLKEATFERPIQIENEWFWTEANS